MRYFLIRVYLPSATTKGIMAMARALLIATASSLWCFAQLPVILRGIIFPLSVTKLLRIAGYL
jgi:hypothetical protein